MCPGPAKFHSHACMAIDGAKPMSVGIVTAQMLQYVYQTDVGAQRKNSTPTGATNAEIVGNVLARPRASNQRSAGASGSNDSVHQADNKS